ncbi:MAG TPA: S8 family serine peptidase [Acidimicrobiales bacterium]|nr:S8 family serine peptidase [Acidimicrobiales bacterium]
MRKRDKAVVGIAGAVALAGGVLAAGPALAVRPSPVGALETVVVKLASSQLRAAASVLAGAPSAPKLAPGGRYIYKVRAGQAASFIAHLQASGKVSYATVSGRVHATAVTPNDPCYAGCASPFPVAVEDDQSQALAGTFDQANLAAVHAPRAWGITKGSASIKVAVLDTGVEASNPDLAGKVIMGPTLCQNDSAPDTCTPGTAANNDMVGHGTHVSGIIAANTNNGAGIAGLGWNTQVTVYKVLDDQGNGSDADVDTGIIDATLAGNRVINLSLSGGVCQEGAGGPVVECLPTDPDMTNAIDFALSHGVVVVAAAGNDGQAGSGTIPEFPAAYPGVLSVAATDNSGAVTYFSERGAAANIAAPGLDVLSTWNDGNYALASGTSMSSPTVAAAAALVLAANPSLSGAQVAGILRQSAAPIPGDPIAGGFLDVGAAVASAVTTPASPLVDGYDLAGADGSVYSFGSAANFGSLAGLQLNRPVVGIAVQPRGVGYRMDASDGGVFAFGDAGFYGSEGGHPLNRPVVGMAATPDGRGYWLVASDGGIFTFGDAGYHGSTGWEHLNRPIVGMAATSDGGGYWLAASDGGIFNFGDAAFHGSAAASPVPAPIVGMGS